MMSEDYLDHTVTKNKSLSDLDDCSYVSSSDDSEDENRDFIETEQIKKTCLPKRNLSSHQNWRQIREADKDNMRSKNHMNKFGQMEEKYQFKKYSHNEVSRISKDMKNLKIENNNSPEKFHFNNIDKKDIGINIKSESSLSLDLTFKRDVIINSKFYPPKTKVCKDDSKKNIGYSNLNVSTFSTYLENNPMLRYFHNSPNMNSAGETINFDTNGLTKPTAFFVRRSDKDLFKKPIENGQSPDKNEMELTIIPICENVNNAFISMNVNMNVTNNAPINNSEVNMTNPSPGNMFSNIQHLFGQNDKDAANTNNGYLMENIHNNNTNDTIRKFNNQINNEYDFEYNPNLFSPNNNITKFPDNKTSNNRYKTFNELTFSNNFNEIGRDNIRNSIYSGDVNKNYMNNFNYPNNYLNIMDINYNNNCLMNNSNFQMQMANNINYNNATRNSKRPNTYGSQSNNSQPFLNTEKNMINMQIPNQNFQREPYMCYNPNKKYNSNINNVMNNLGVVKTREINKTSKIKQNLPNYMTMDNNELARYIYHLSKDQAGCRFIQKKMDDEGNSFISLIYPGIMEHLVELMNDSFGNYLIQKLFTFLSEEQIFQVLGIINPHIELIGTNSHGTRVLQRLLDFMSSESLILSFASIIRSSIIELMKDINGNHILIKFFSTFDLSYTEFAYDILNQNIIEISFHKNGCCSMQKCLEAADFLVKKEIISNIIENCLTLITDPYGNYVVQHVIFLRDFEDNKKIIMNLIKDIVFFSKQKFSSNVVEKCFDNCDDDSRNILISTLMRKEIIIELLFDMYGNYVVQKLLAVTSNESRNFILTTIAPLMERLRLLNFGPKIYNKLILTYPQLSSLMFSINITSISKNNSGRSSLNNSKDGIKSSSRETVHNINLPRDQRYSYTVSKFANNQASEFSQQNMEANMVKPKNKNSS